MPRGEHPTRRGRSVQGTLAKLLLFELTAGIATALAVPVVCKFTTPSLSRSGVGQAIGPCDLVPAAELRGSLHELSCTALYTVGLPFHVRRGRHTHYTGVHRHRACGHSFRLPLRGPLLLHGRAQLPESGRTARWVHLLLLPTANPPRARATAA